MKEIHGWIHIIPSMNSLEKIGEESLKAWGTLISLQWNFEGEELGENFANLRDWMGTGKNKNKKSKNNYE